RSSIASFAPVEAPEGTGASTGAKEAIELRDGDRTRGSRLCRTSAVEAVNGELCEALLGRDATEQQLLDRTMIELDGTDN
ncbi:hypothetical protein Q8G48_28960, partial [Klebsiella pneumoniae]